ncbi:endonuclease [Sungkyunkwania multivorans]|uniref:Endonuclease n=1 Tax=Sungkyunkwania multivorans TaxID=1173618 RepID=A0ABW3CZX3_9FLAO
MGLFSKKTGNSDLHTVAFYNLENLFDIVDNPHTFDDDFTKYGKKRWNKKRYEKKLFKLGTAISNVGFDQAKKAPAIVGVAEVENQRVLEDLVATKHLKNKDYGVVHYDSPDERGIDTGLLYQKRFFEVDQSEVFPLQLVDEEGRPDHTRDILKVSGVLNGEYVHVLVNHWPSRRAGANETQHKRILAAQNAQKVVQSIRSQEENPKIIIMGDFNDDPHSTSIKEHLVTDELYNPMETLLSYTKGSLSHKGSWNLFDQIIFTHNFFETKEGGHKFAHADVFNPRFLAEYDGRYKGNPFRTYFGRKYLGGYSDHFPVYVHLRKQ